MLIRAKINSASQPREQDDDKTKTEEKCRQNKLKANYKYTCRGIIQGFGLQSAQLKRPKTQGSWEDLWQSRAIRNPHNDEYNNSTRWTHG